MSEYFKITNEYFECVSIILKPSSNDAESVIDIWVEDLHSIMNINSPFKTISEAEEFADKIIKLLNEMET